MKNQRYNLGPSEQVPMGQGKCFVVDGRDIAVFRSRSGRFFAVSNLCPHRQGPLSEGVMGEGTIVCPLHGHKFDLATGKGSEAHECVATYQVREEKGQLVFGGSDGQ